MISHFQSAKLKNKDAFDMSCPSLKALNTPVVLSLYVLNAHVKRKGENFSQSIFAFIFI